MFPEISNQSWWMHRFHMNIAIDILFVFRRNVEIKLIFKSIHMDKQKWIILFIIHRINLLNDEQNIYFLLLFFVNDHCLITNLAVVGDSTYKPDKLLLSATWRLKFFGGRESNFFGLKMEKKSYFTSKFTN